MCKNLLEVNVKIYYRNNNIPINNDNKSKAKNPKSNNRCSTT